MKPSERIKEITKEELRGTDWENSNINASAQAILKYLDEEWEKAQETAPPNCPHCKADNEYRTKRQQAALTPLTKK